MLSVIIPHYNQKDVLYTSLDRLKAYLDDLGVNYEIVVVDDGSRLSDRPLSRDLGSRARLIQLARNQGKGRAVRTGMLAANGACRLFIDADLPFDLRIIEASYDHIISRQAHFVAGLRQKPSLREREGLLAFRAVSSVVFNFLVSRFLIPHLRDSQCGVKACSAAFVELAFPMLRIDRFAFDVELFTIMHRNHLPIERIPVTQLATSGSTVALIRDSLEMALSLLVIFTRMNLGRYDDQKLVMLAKELDRRSPSSLKRVI